MKDLTIIVVVNVLVGAVWQVVDTTAGTWVYGNAMILLGVAAIVFLLVMIRARSRKFDITNDGIEFATLVLVIVSGFCAALMLPMPVGLVYTLVFAFILRVIWWICQRFR